MDKHTNLADLWPPHGACYLWGTVGSLCRSHIIPKFVGDWFYWHLNDGARKLQQISEGLSPRQKQVSHDKLSELVKKDPQATAASDVFRAFDADVGLFGDVVFERNDDEPERGS